MKYRRLAPEELKELEKEFVNFLASAQITAHDWQKMKAEKPEQASEMIDVFSDVVYDKVLRKIAFIEFSDSHSVRTYRCDKEEIVLAGIECKPGATLDLSKVQVTGKWLEAHMNSLQLVYAKRPYKGERESEILAMLDSGCLIADGKLHELLMRLRPGNA